LIKVLVGDYPPVGEYQTPLVAIEWRWCWSTHSTLTKKQYHGLLPIPKWKAHFWCASLWLVASNVSVAFGLMSQSLFVLEP
jgi:hypothetical protein